MGSDGVIEKSVPGKTENWWLVRGVMMFNFFIAVLCQLYEECESASGTYYTRTRAHFMLDQLALRKGLRTMGCCKRKENGKYLSETHMYLWFCCQKDFLH